MPYTTFPYDELKSQIASVAEVISRDTPTGRYLFSRYGGRLIGLYPGQDDFNVLWVYGNIKQHITEEQWLIGGERLWIAPERSFFYENPRDFEGYHVPTGIDPGEYIKNGELTFANTFALLNYVNNDTYFECINQRTFALLEDPYRSGLQYAGVSIYDKITLGHPEIEMAAWSIAQIYTCGAKRPGTVLFAANPNAVPLTYLGSIDKQRFTVTPGYVRFQLDGADMCTMAVRPEDSPRDNPCKAVYVSPCPYSTEKWFCVMKRSPDVPVDQNGCMDVSTENPDGPRGAIQAYNTGAEYLEDEYLPFGELSIQLKKGKTIDGQTISEGSHELLSYIGSKQEILELARTALRLSTPPTVF
jgi:hypothetical protein